MNRIKHKLLQYSSSQFFSTTTTEIALAIFSMLIGILSARLLGPGGRGELAIVILWPSVLATVGNLGIKDALVYYQASERYSKGQLNALALVLAFFQSLVLIIIGLWLVPYLTQSKGFEVTRMSLGFLIFIPLNLVSLYMLSLLQGRLSMRVFNAIRVSINPLYLFFIVFLWLLKQVSVWNFAIALLTANLIVACVAAWTAISDGKVEWQFNLTLFREISSYGIRNHFGSISNMLNQRLDQMLMAVVLSSEELGWYVVAVSFSGLVTLVSRSFSILIFPKLASVKGDQERRDLVCAYSRFNLTGTIMLAMLLMAVAPFAIPLVYTKSFGPSVIPAEILAVAAILLSIGKNWSAVFQGMGKPLVSAKAEGVSLVVTFIALIILLRPLGIIGASLASLAAYGISVSYLYIQLKRQWYFSFNEVLKIIPLRKIFGLLIPLDIRK